MMWALLPEGEDLLIAQCIRTIGVGSFPQDSSVDFMYIRINAVRTGEHELSVHYFDIICLTHINDLLVLIMIFVISSMNLCL